MIINERCRRERLVGFLTNQLEIDERLDFLDHLEVCARCWDEVYSARKAEHPHYYKTTSRQVKLSARDLKRIDASHNVIEEEAEYQVA